MNLLRAFAADVCDGIAAFGRDIAAGLRDFGHDIAAPFRDAAYMRRERRRLERGE